MHYVDLHTQYQRLKPALLARFEAVMEHGSFIMGPEIAELEARLAAMTGARHVLSCASGTDALLIPLLAWGIKPGDAVLTTPFTFYATAEVIALLGAVPVFVDVDPRTCNIDPAGLGRALEALSLQNPAIHPLPRQALETRLTPRVVIPVDLFGQAADYDALIPIARLHGLKLMEDGAQAFGGTSRGKPVCNLGCEVATTSFFPAKPLGCYGDGGAIFTDDDDLAATMRSIRVHGKGSDKYENLRVGINGRMDTLQAALMLPKLDIFHEEIAARQRLAARYTERFQYLPGLIPPHVAPGNQSAWAQYTVLASRRDALAAHLKAAGIPTMIYYPKPLHIQPVFAHLGYQPEDMPVSFDLSRRVLSLPLHPYLSEADQDRICDTVEAFCRGNA